MSDLVGRTLGPYELQDRIGAGGMATVYRGLHRNLGVTRAVKVLQPVLTADQSIVGRFRAEAQIVGSLRHPNIVSVYEIGEHGGRLYLVMDLIDGLSLAALLRRDGPLPVERTVRLLFQLASALDYSHRLGVIHRDVKPGNILVDAHDHLSLFDFGVARAVAIPERLTKPGLVVGTPEYLAPELVSGGEADRRADLYSLGVVAYEMLTGRLPFAEQDAMAVLYAQVYRVPPSLCALQPSLPAAVERVVIRQLAKSPEARFPSAEAFVEELTRAALTRAVPGSSATPPPMPRYEPPDRSTLDPGLPADQQTLAQPSISNEEPPTPRPFSRTLPAEPVGGATLPPLFPVPDAPVESSGPATVRTPTPPPLPRPGHSPEPAPSRPSLRPADRMPVPLRPRAVQVRPPAPPARGSRAWVALLILGVVLVVAAGALASGRVASLVGLGPTPTVAPATSVPATATSAASGGPTAGGTTPAPLTPPATSAASPAAMLSPIGAAPPSGPPLASDPTVTAAPTAGPTPPPSPEQQLQAANAQVEAGDFPGALAALAALAETAPDTEGLDDARYRAHLEYGAVLHAQGALDASYAEYGKALEIRPDDPPALEGQRQVVLSKLWNTVEAAWGQDTAVATAALEEILALDPSYRDANVKLYALLVAEAQRHLEAGETERARELLSRAHEVYPEGEEARVMLDELTPPPAAPPAEPAVPPARQAPPPAQPPSRPQRPSLPDLPGLPGLPGLPLPRP